MLAKDPRAISAPRSVSSERRCVITGNRSSISGICEQAKVRFAVAAAHLCWGDARGDWGIARGSWRHPVPAFRGVLRIPLHPGIFRHGCTGRDSPRSPASTSVGHCPGDPMWLVSARLQFHYWQDCDSICLGDLRHVLRVHHNDRKSDARHFDVAYLRALLLRYVSLDQSSWARWASRGKPKATHQIYVLQHSNFHISP